VKEALAVDKLYYLTAQKPHTAGTLSAKAKKNCPTHGLKRMVMERMTNRDTDIKDPGENQKPRDHLGRKKDRARGKLRVAYASRTQREGEGGKNASKRRPTFSRKHLGRPPIRKRQKRVPGVTPRRRTDHEPHWAGADPAV